MGTTTKTEEKPVVAQPEKQKEPPVVKEYPRKVVLLEDLLASAPADPSVYKTYIAANTTPENQAEEVETLPIEVKEEKGWSVFHSDPKGIFLYEYHVKGYLKAAAEAVTGKILTAYKSKIDKWVFITPRRIYVKRDGKPILKPEDVLERSIRVMTPLGPRVSLKRSDVIKAGATFEFTISVLPLGQKEITEELLDSWLDYGKYCGFGEWRNGGYGRVQITT